MSLRETTLDAVPRRRGPQKPITRLSIERIIGRSVAILCVVFGAQAVPFAIAQMHELKQPWGILITLVSIVALLATAVAGFTVRFVAEITAVVPIVYLVTLATWPLAVMNPMLVQPSPPWLWYICNIALAAAVVSFSPAVAGIYVVLVPAIYIAVRVSPSGGGASFGVAVLDASFTAILGAAVLVLAELLRRTAAATDTAQTAAVIRYSEAVRQHATEVERTRVDSIVHDGVLTAMISAARAYSDRERTLAVAMSDASMKRLTSAAAAPIAGAATVPLTTVRGRLASAIDHLDPTTRLTSVDDAGTLELSADVAQSIGDAAAQALVNSDQHAGEGASRWVSVTDEDGVAVIRVGDDGAGFDTSIRSDRLGVRVSILERMSSIGGHAEITSAPGEGTIITLRWPHVSQEALEQGFDD